MAAILLAAHSLLRSRCAQASSPPHSCQDPPCQLQLLPASHDSCTLSAPSSPGDPPHTPGAADCQATAASIPAVHLPGARLPQLRQPGNFFSGGKTSLGCSVSANPRVVPASPFAAVRTRLSSDSAFSLVGSASRCSLDTSCRLPGASLAPPMLRSSLFLPSQRQLSAVSNRNSFDSLESPLEELLQHRDLEDAALLEPYTSDAMCCLVAMPPPPPLTAAALPAELRPWLVPSEDVEVLRRPGKQGEDWVLGEGASGRVFKALLRGQPVAAKRCALRGAEAQEAFVAEALCLLQLSHPNVVALRGLCLDGVDGGTLLLEYCEGRDLYSVLRLQTAGSQERLFSWQRHGRRVACHVARALAYLHSQGVVHMDIKSSNCMLSAHGTAKLADLGLARRQTKPAFSQLPPVGTFEWAAPELLAGGRNCTNAVDIYSFGVLLWEIVTGERPLRGALCMPSPDECPADIADLILACGDPDPEARPTAAEVLRRLQAAPRA